MDEVTRELPFIFVCLDDILVARTLVEEHEGRLGRLFEQLDEHGLVVEPRKRIIGVEALDFLGHRISPQDIKPLESVVRATEHFPSPTFFRNLREFLELLNSHRRFTPSCAQMLQPLTDLPRRDSKNPPTFHWSSDHERSFQEAKTQLATAVLLNHPLPGARTRLMVGASTTPAGAVLQQHDGTNWRPLGFPKRLKPSEARYSTFGKEMLAIYCAAKHFHLFLKAVAFTF